MRVVLVGPPGAGKGTQAGYIAERFSIPKIVTGEIFRTYVASKTALGILASMHMDAGDLVPDSITVGMMRERLAEPDVANGFLLDGFPRNVAQAYELDAMLGDLRTTLDVVVQLDLDVKHIVRRLSVRQFQQNRDDDRADTVRHRLDVYAEQTAPLLHFYQSRRQLLTIDGLGSIESVAKRVSKALSSFDRSSSRGPELAS